MEIKAYFEVVKFRKNRIETENNKLFKQKNVFIYCIKIGSRANMIIEKARRYFF